VAGLSGRGFGKSKRESAARPDWLAGALVDDRDRITPNLANVLLPLRLAPELREAFAFDEMARLTTLICKLPGAQSADSGPDKYPRPLRDSDVSRTQEWVQLNGLPKIGGDVTHQAIDQRARERSFHPIREYLESLIWDHQPRLDRWLTYYLGVDSSSYASAIGRMFLIAMTARIFKPGCKADHMLVMEGDQGSLKSTACYVLAGDWFSDCLPDIRDDRVASQHIRGKWLLEISELSSIGRAESEALKAFISRTTERYLARYGRNEVIEPRQCVFVGTTNKSAYLKDETGARRFWPVKVGSIDLEALQHDRDQLFAEATYRYHAGERWWPDSEFEREHIKPQQDDRFEIDAWEEAIVGYVAPLAEVRLSGVASNALNMEIRNIGTADRNRIVAILTKLGFAPGKKDRLGRPYTRKSGNR
jgi:predicted P-loop ATPase